MYTYGKIKISVKMIDILNKPGRFLMRKFLLLTAVLILGVPTMLLAQVNLVNYESDGQLTELTFQDGCSSQDRFIVHQLKSTGSPKGSVILLPGALSGFDMYEDLVPLIVEDGYDVYGFTPRPHTLTGAIDLTDPIYESWGMSTYSDDVELLSYIAHIFSGTKPVVMGFSLGTMLSIAAIDRNPQLYAGGIFLDGSLYQDDPTFQGAFETRCRGLTDLLDSGTYLENVNGPMLKSIIQSGINAPDDTSPFYPVLTNQQFFYYAMTTPGDPPEGEAARYTYCAGDLVGGLTYSDESRLNQFAEQLFEYDPIALVRDYKCAYAGDRTYTSNLAAFTGPILSIQSGEGFGEANEDTLLLFENAQITRMTNEEFGHVDWYYNTDYENVFVNPVLNWLNAVYI